MNKIIRTLICDGQVSLTVLQTTDLVNKAIEIHSLGSSAAKIFGGLLTCGAYMAASLKDTDGSVSLTIKAKNADGAVSVSADAGLNVRGYADGTCEKTLKGGSMTVVRDDGYSTPYVGVCEISSDDVSDILATYFQQSEQVPTAVRICVVTDVEKCAFAGGVVMQLLPDADDNQIALASEAFEEYGREAEDPSLFSADDIFGKYFAPLVSGEDTYFLFPDYVCNCSERKIRGILAALGKTELLKTVEEQGCVKVHCHYCNKDYVYDKNKIEELF